MNGKLDDEKRQPKSSGVLSGILHSLRLKLPQKEKWVLWAGVLGAAVLLGLGFLDEPADSPADKTADEVMAAGFETEAYEQTLENRLSVLLSKVEGAGEVTVMVTLENGTQAVYAQAYQQSTDTSQTQNDGISERSSYSTDYILVETGGDEQALTETVLQPTVKGVAVVCTGAQNMHVVSRITELVSTVLGIPSNRICVTN